jgi:PAB1-binding protein PBP1
MMLKALLVVALVAMQQAVAAPPNLILSVYPNVACSGNPAATELYYLPENTCFAHPSPAGFPVLINGAPVQVGSAQINCPANTFTYGPGTQCNSTAVPTSQVCVVETSQGVSYKASCIPDICNPDNGMPKDPCDARVAACANWGYQMKW